MSYCRWSCDDWQSDVYCFASGSGFVTRVTLLPVRTVGIGDIAAALPRAGLPMDGKTLIDSDLDAFHQRLLQLQAMGYHIPQSALVRIERELADLTEGTYFEQPLIAAVG